MSSFGKDLFSESITTTYQGKQLELDYGAGREIDLNENNTLRSLYFRNLDNDAMRTSHFRFLFYKK